MNTSFKRWASGLIATCATWIAQAGVLPGPLVDTQCLAARPPAQPRRGMSRSGPRPSA